MSCTLQDLIVYLIQEIQGLKEQFRTFDSTLSEMKWCMNTMVKDGPSMSTFKSERSDNE